MRPVNTSSSSDSHGATAALAAWAAQAPGHWTDSAWHSATHAFEDTIASMVAGAGDSGSAVVRACVFRGSVPVIGRTDGADAASAALANGYAAHAVEMDENFLVGLGHLACSVLPGLLSIAHEAGVKGYEAGSWASLAVPTGTPADVVAQLNRALQEAQRAPSFISFVAERGGTIEGSTPAAFKAFATAERAKWGALVRSIPGLKDDPDR